MLLGWCSMRRSLVYARCVQAVSQRPITILMWAPALLRDVKGIYNGPCPDTLPANNDVKATYFNTYGLGENHEVAGGCQPGMSDNP